MNVLHVIMNTAICFSLSTKEDFLGKMAIHVGFWSYVLFDMDSIRVFS